MRDLISSKFVGHTIFSVSFRRFQYNDNTGDNKAKSFDKNENGEFCKFSIYFPNGKTKLVRLFFFK